MRIHDALGSASLRGIATGLACVFLLGFSMACAPGGQSEAPAEEAHGEEHETAAMEAAESSEDMEGPRVYFMTPEDGDTVTSPVTLEFGHENFKIEPKGDIHAGAGHHHVGIDTECLPAGEVIPEAAPWVHLGDGSEQMQMQLPPGKHTLTIQIGDGEHRTLDEPGLCQTITVTVEG